MLTNISSTRRLVRPRGRYRLAFELLERRFVLTGLVGVDFDLSGGTSPGNWTQVNAVDSAVLLSDLSNEEGNVTSIGLDIFTNGTTVASTPAATSIPSHSQSLAGLDGHLETTDLISMSWNGLNGGNEYEVWVFGLHGANAINQFVEINNGEFQFTQSTDAGVLAVNDQAGDSGRTLDSYSTKVTVGFSGQISILIRAGTSFSVAGVAIREIQPPGPEIDVLGNGISIASGDSNPDFSDGTAFGGADVFAETVTNTFSIANTGNEDLNVTEISVLGGESGDFTISGVTLPLVVPFGQSATFDVEFDPSDSGLRDTTLRIVNDDADESTYQFDLAGIGTFNITPDRFEPNDSIGAAFDLGTGDQRHDDLTIHQGGNLDGFLWTASTDGTLTVDLLYEHDFGALELRVRSPVGPFFPILGISITPDDNERVSIDVVENQTVVIEIFGILGGVQPDYDLLINGPEPVGPEIVVEGNGIPILDEDPLPKTSDGRDFGIRAPGSAPVTRTFTIENAGTGTLSLTGAPVTIGGDNPQDFSVTQPAQSTISPGGDTTFQVTFTPNTPGLRFATVSISNNDANENPFSFDVRGFTGASDLVGIDFGDPTTTLSNWTPVGSQAAPVTLTNLINESGDATPFDLEIHYPGGELNVAPATPDITTVPGHLQALDGVDGQIFTAQPTPNITMTFMDLTPGADYEIWVFASDNEFEILQDFTIVGTQTLRFAQVNEPAHLPRHLYVNGEAADFRRLLDSYAEVVTADGSGELEIFLQPFVRGIVATSSEALQDGEIAESSSANDAVLLAMAIREVEPDPGDDFGDAPTAAQSGFASDYPTLLPGGARHTESTLRLGTAVDVESDGQPTATADGDGDDDDGIRMLTSVVATDASNTTASFLVTTSAAGMLDAWIDFNRDGDWFDSGEQLFASSLSLGAGETIVNFEIPASSLPGETFARFRLSSTGGLAPDGPAPDGEVEDYRVTVLDGDAGADVRVDLIVGEVEIIAAGGDAVVQLTTGFRLFAAPGSALTSWELLATNGDDRVGLGDLEDVMPAPVPMIFDGGDGVDRLSLIDGGQTLNLLDRSLNQLANLEIIDVESGANRLLLDSQSVVAASNSFNTIVVIHNDNDVVDYIGDDWMVESPIFVFGGQRHVLLAGSARVETINQLPFQNPLEPTDVNFSEETSALDALQIINFMARFDTIPVPLNAPTSADDLPVGYYDVNASRTASALDALQVINFLGRQSNGSQEIVALLPPVVDDSDSPSSVAERTHETVFVRRETRGAANWDLPQEAHSIAKPPAPESDLVDLESTEELQSVDRVLSDWPAHV